MNVYATIDEVKRYLGGGYVPLKKEDKDQQLWVFCIQASRAIDKLASKGNKPFRVFYPQAATVDMDHPYVGETTGSTSELPLRRDLLEVSTLTTQNGGITISSSDYLLVQRGVLDRYDVTPYNLIKLHPSGTTTAFSYLNTPYKANAITGIWGYHDDWGSAWEDSLDTVQDAPLSDSATQVTVLDPSGVSEYGITPKFTNQQLIKIESEYLWVTGVDLVGKKLTIRRGANGTTAASHVQGTPIYVYRPPYDVNLAVLTLAAWLDKRKDTVGRPEIRQVRGDQRIWIVPPDLPPEVKVLIEPHSRAGL